jgi:DNA-binding XRE family transcriptional regulator
MTMRMTPDGRRWLAEVGLRIKAIRAERGITQPALAAKIDLDR